jgi:hypothetical protein
VGVIEHRRDVTAQMEAQRRAADVGIAKTMRETEIHGVRKADGSRIYAPKDKVAEEINERHGRTLSFVQGLEEIKRLREKNGYELSTWTSDAKKYAHTLINDLQNDYTVMLEQGVIQKSDRQRYDEIFGTANGVIDNTARLDALISSAKRRAFNDIKNRTGQVPSFDWGAAPPGFQPGATIAPPKAPRAPGLAQVMDENRAADVKAARERDLLEADPVQSWILSP